MDRLCKNCEFFDGQYSECRRYPPHLVLIAQDAVPQVNLQLRGGSQSMAVSAPKVQYGFPKTVPGKWWCAEFQAKEEE